MGDRLDQQVMALACGHSPACQVAWSPFCLGLSWPLPGCGSQEESSSAPPGRPLGTPWSYPSQPPRQWQFIVAALGKEHVALPRLCENLCTKVPST